MSIKKEPFSLRNPFSEEFMIAWEYWKNFKKEQFRFSYKPIGEQAAIDNLFELSLGNEQTAKLIIKQSLVNGWRGLFALKELPNGNTKTGAATRESVNQEFASRNYAKRETRNQ